MIFHVLFLSKRRPLICHRRSPPFFNVKYPGKSADEVHRSFLEGRQGNIQIKPRRLEQRLSQTPTNRRWEQCSGCRPKNRDRWAFPGARNLFDALQLPRSPPHPGEKLTNKTSFGQGAPRCSPLPPSPLHPFAPRKNVGQYSVLSQAARYIKSALPPINPIWNMIGSRASSGTTAESKRSAWAFCLCTFVFRGSAKAIHMNRWVQMWFVLQVGS